MTLFDAPRTFISLCINMSNMVLEHVGGAARHCIVCTFFCVSSSCRRFLSGVVWSLRFFGDEEACLWRSGEWHLRHAPRWCTERGLQTDLKMAHVLCRHVVPGVGSVGSPGFYAVCKPNAPPPSRDRCEDGMTCARISRRCLVSSACCGTDAGAATAAMREDDRDEDLGSF
jgi:hypothetical protein